MRTLMFLIAIFSLTTRSYAFYFEDIRDHKESSSLETFYQLPLVDWEMKTIHKLVSTLAEKNVFELALEKKSLEKKGDKIYHVHPFRFIGYIFSDPHLKKCMYEIKKSFFKWHTFVDGFGDKMSAEKHHRNLERYIPGFAHSLNINPDKVRQYVDDKDWEGLLKFLI